MYPLIPISVKALLVRNFISRSPLRRGFLLLPLALAWFALSPVARAVDPPPDGGYPNENTAEGEDALFSLTAGAGNTAIGYQALYFNTTGFANTANGLHALYNNTTGFWNTATGSDTLSNNTTGGFNTANGRGALSNNTTGSYNTASGVQALYFNTTGANNAASGYDALLSNTTGSENTATGYQALYGNTTGFANVANGFDALYSNTTGFWNTATGSDALFNNTTGGFNTANGRGALSNNTIGSYNTANGVQALNGNTTGINNTADGYDALLSNTTGSNNIALGFQAGINQTTGSSNIDIGHVGVAAESNTTRIGTNGVQTRAFIAGISGVAVPGGVGVIVGNNGKLGTVVSSKRFKDEIKSMNEASEVIHSLRPVTFRYKEELDPEGIPQFGLVAEEVAKVNPDLVARDEHGKPYTVRYEAVNAMLLNEFLKEHRKVEQQEATIVRQQKEIEALTAGLRDVKARLEMDKSAPQMAINDSR
jgi:hypothetical protein